MLQPLGQVLSKQQKNAIQEVMFRMLSTQFERLTVKAGTQLRANERDRAKTTEYCPNKQILCACDRQESHAHTPRVQTSSAPTSGILGGTRTIENALTVVISRDIGAGAAAWQLGIYLPKTSWQNAAAKFANGARATCTTSPCQSHAVLHRRYAAAAWTTCRRWHWALSHRKAYNTFDTTASFCLTPA